MFTCSWTTIILSTTVRIYDRRSTYLETVPASQVALFDYLVYSFVLEECFPFFALLFVGIFIISYITYFDTLCLKNNTPYKIKENDWRACHSGSGQVEDTEAVHCHVRILRSK